ncbi:MAG: hypothetical protein AAGI09_11955 [Pseudomonadota bacterium]
MFEPLVKLTSASDLVEYPLGPEDTLESHYFVVWKHREWLNSNVRMKGSPECRAYFFDLVCASMDQSPVGTLPNDIEVIAKLAHADTSHLKRLCEGRYGPLHNWEPCLCDGEVRLMNERVLLMLQDAISRKHDNRARNEAANAVKRKQRLRSAVAGFNLDLGKNDAAILWMDQWLEEKSVGYRSARWIERAIAAWSNHQLDQRRPRPG